MLYKKNNLFIGRFISKFINLYRYNNNHFMFDVNIVSMDYMSKLFFILLDYFDMEALNLVTMDYIVI
jgi:hypothetical protein